MRVIMGMNTRMKKHATPKTEAERLLAEARWHDRQGLKEARAGRHETAVLHHRAATELARRAATAREEN
jgi:hypothetical protein